MKEIHLPKSSRDDRFTIAKPVPAVYSKDSSFLRKRKGRSRSNDRSDNKLASRFVAPLDVRQFYSISPCTATCPFVAVCPYDAAILPFKQCRRVLAGVRFELARFPSYEKGARRTVSPWKRYSLGIRRGMGVVGKR